jgi:hypothetical protein
VASCFGGIGHVTIGLVHDDPTGSGPGGRLDPSGSEAVKVRDRRKFDRSGQLRDEAPGEELRTGSSTLPGAEARKEGADAPHSGTRGGPAPDKGRGEPKPMVDFQQFAYFLYVSALQELGIPTEPGAPRQAPDLERARFFIDVLHVLQAKTRGNLEPGEAKFLEEVLYNLRMQFVGLSQGRPPA